MPRYSHFTELRNSVNVNPIGIFYLPKDPLGIYRKLLRVFLLGNQINFGQVKEVGPVTRNLFSLIEKRNYDDSDKINNNSGLINFNFIKWLMQEIPSEFYLYSSLIAANRAKLMESALNSSMIEVWIDTPKVKNKIKIAKLNEHVLQNLTNKKLVLPTYNEICKQIYSWGNKTIYNFGIINESEKVVLR